MDNFLDFNYEINDSQLEKFEQIFNQLLKITQEKLTITKPLSLSVNYIDDEKSIYLNNKYRSKDYVGDVISFPIDDEFEIYEQLEFKEIGDIFIAPNEAQRKADLYNHSFFDEMCWLFVHGLLHILGYDHEEEQEDSEIMFGLTDEILNEINVKYTMLN